LSELTGIGLSRKGWLHLVGFVSLVTMLPIAWNPEWIGTLDLIFGSGMFTVGALMAAIGAGWGLGSKRLHAQLEIGLSPRWATILTAWIRYVIPLTLAAILVGYVVSLAGGGTSD